jgi:hypothetical protein
MELEEDEQKGIEEGEESVRVRVRVRVRQPDPCTLNI